MSDDNPNVVLNDREDCKVLRFTGGTTGLPKGIMYTLDNWMATRDLHFAMADPIPARSARMLHIGPISHASGIVFVPILFRGGCNMTMNDRSLSDLVLERREGAGDRLGDGAGNAEHAA